MGQKADELKLSRTRPLVGGEAFSVDASLIMARLSADVTSDYGSRRLRAQQQTLC